MNLSCSLLVNLFHLLFYLSNCHGIDLKQFYLSKRIYEIKKSLMNYDRLITNEKSQFQEKLDEMNNTAFNESASIEEYFNCITRVFKLQIIDEINTECVEIMKNVEDKYAKHYMKSSKSSKIKRCFKNDAENVNRELIEKGTENCRKPNATNEEEINKQTRLLSSLFYNVYKLNVNLFEHQLLLDIYNKMNS
uniref:Uncharacterized protein n=1 Tax=Schistosoma mansoni TaxID=6183 RepID=A0A3Q0KG93_SCHMA